MRGEAPRGKVLDYDSGATERKNNHYLVTRSRKKSAIHDKVVAEEATGTVGGDS